MTQLDLIPPEQSDSVNHPSHYASGKIEVIEAIEDWGLNFHRGNAVKYAARAGKKDPTKEIEDLEKAVWYLKREIENLRAKAEGREVVRPNDMNPLPPIAQVAASAGPPLPETVYPLIKMLGEWSSVDLPTGVTRMAWVMKYDAPDLNHCEGRVTEGFFWKGSLK